MYVLCPGLRHGSCIVRQCARRLATTDAALTYAQRFGKGVKPSAFTGKPDYYEALFFMEDVLLRAESVSAAASGSASSASAGLSAICKQLGRSASSAGGFGRTGLDGLPSTRASGGSKEESPQSHTSRRARLAVVVPWLPREAMAERVGFDLAPLEYRRIRDMLTRIAQHIGIPSVLDFVSAFSPATKEELSRLSRVAIAGDMPTADSKGSETLDKADTGVNTAAPTETTVVEKKTVKDALFRKYSSAEPHPVRRLPDGRIVAEGRRKTSVARVQLVRGSGECYVNGRPAALHFSSPQEMLRLADALGLAGLLSTRPGKGVNAWLTVSGGGPAGQAGACAHALAKAAAALRPECRDALVRAGGLLFRDPRCHERKKAGQPGARKKFTWVKR